MAIKHFDGRLGLYDNRGCIGGKHQIFDYDDTQFTIKNVNNGDGTPPYMSLVYIGNETNGCKIKIPEGLKTACFMFADKKLTEIPIIPASIQDDTCMFKGDYSKEMLDNIEWNLENRGFDMLDENQDEMTSLSSMALINKLDTLIDMTSEYYRAAVKERPHNRSEVENAYLQHNAECLCDMYIWAKDAQHHENLIVGDYPVVLEPDKFSKMLMTPAGASKLFNQLNYMREHVYGGAFGKSPYADNADGLVPYDSDSIPEPVEDNTIDSGDNAKEFGDD